MLLFIIILNSGQWLDTVVLKRCFNCLQKLLCGDSPSLTTSNVIMLIQENNHLHTQYAFGNKSRWHNFDAKWHCLLPAPLLFDGYFSLVTFPHLLAVSG